jgi:hypothetical protein
VTGKGALKARQIPETKWKTQKENEKEMTPVLCLSEKWYMEEGTGSKAETRKPGGRPRRGRG